MSWKKGALFLYMICSVSTLRGMVLENLSEPENNLQMPVEILDENLDEIVRPQQGLTNQQFLQNLLQPWPQRKIPFLYIIQDESLDSNTLPENPAIPYENEYNQNDLVSAMKRSVYNRKLQQRKTSQAKNERRILACAPTREEIFRLLVAVAEIRDTNTERIVNICNKKQPIKIIVKNSRFMAK